MVTFRPMVINFALRKRKFDQFFLNFNRFAVILKILSFFFFSIVYDIAIKGRGLKTYCFSVIGGL